MENSQKKIKQILSVSEMYNNARLPKSVNKDTIAVILKVFAQFPDNQDFSASEFNKVIGISQTTLRRYFSFLLEENVIQYEYRYAKIGPPVKKYKLHERFNSF